MRLTYRALDTVSPKRVGKFQQKPAFPRPHRFPEPNERLIVDDRPKKNGGSFRCPRFSFLCCLANHYEQTITPVA
ncbi:MAG TPA: hypothetical protein VLJ83_03715, partial [Gemmatimonadaceae bacterium]|nr:hypothetical protein [Gemmatimonadaceae bacterium]